MVSCSTARATVPPLRLLKGQFPEKKPLIAVNCVINYTTCA